MKTITTGSSTFLTGSDIADAVLHYGLALARVHQVDLVDIPVVEADGGEGRAGFTVGWLSSVSTTTAHEVEPELREQRTVDALADRAGALRGMRARAFTTAELVRPGTADLDFWPA